MKEGMRKDKKLELKPCIYNKRNKSLHEMEQQIIEEKDSQNKQKYETYKKYQQKIVTPIKLSKQTHYNKYFKENKKNCKTL